MTKRTIKSCSVKMLAIFLSVLMIFYLIPATAYASLFEASGSESAISEAAKHVGEVFEDISRREENVKHFRLEDGTYMAAQYDTAVHALDENGEWQDIDNTLSESGSEYSTSNASIKFAKKITGNESIFTLHENNRKITLSLDGAIKKTAGVATNTETEFDETATTLQKMMTLDKLSSRIIYEDILDGVDLEYIVISNNIKENIVVKERKDTYSYSFTLKLNNLSASLSSIGDIEITEPGSGEILYIIPAPVVYDANMTYASETDAYYTLETIGQKEYRLTVTANTSWMNASDRAFPVVIDPAIYYGGYNMGQMCDTCVSQNYPTSVYGSRTYLKVGYDNANANLKAYVAMRSLPTLPAGSMITEAKLNLIYNGASEGNLAANPLTIVARKIIRTGYTSLWTESSTTYNTAMTYGDILDYKIIAGSTAGNVEDWNITSAVVDWYANSTSNQGVALMPYDMTDTTVHTVQFHSSDNSMTGAYIPFFTIAYVSAIGVEGHYSYQSASAGLAGTGYVNTATGALAFVKPLLSTTDSLMPYTVSMTYNSDFAGKAYQYPNAQTAYSTSYMPYGFKLNINETIIEKRYTNSSAGQSAYYIWADSDGTEHCFLPVGDSTTEYQDEDGLQLTLTISSSTCTIVDDSKIVKTFTKMTSTPASDVYSAWYLTSIKDKNNNTVSFSFDNTLRPTGVNLTPNGSSTISFLTLVYNSNGLLSMIRNDTSKEAIVFRYTNANGESTVTSSEKYLSEIVYAHGNSAVTPTNWTSFYNSAGNTANITVDAKATYTYDSNGRLYRATDTLSGYRIEYTYTSGKVTDIQEYGSKTGSAFIAGQEIGLTYFNGYTEARISGSDDEYNNTDDIITRYCFDKNGRAVNIYSMDLLGTTIYGATAGEYQEAEKVKNNLKTSTAVGGSATNYLLNGGFDTIISNTNAAHWVELDDNEETSTNIRFFSSAFESRAATFIVNAGAADSLTQYVKLPAGTYTLSMSVRAMNCINTRACVIVKSLSTGATITKEIPINENYVTGAFSSFSMTFENDIDDAAFSVTIRVSNDVVSETSSATVDIDNVMLEKGIGNSRYSLVQAGSFDDFAVTDDGAATNDACGYWSMSSGQFSPHDSETAPWGSVGELNGEINGVKEIKQRIYTVSEEITYLFDMNEPYPNDAKTYTISGFAKGTSQVPHDGSVFALRVDVYYYGTTEEESLDSKYFYFQNDLRDWQFVCGSITTDQGKCVQYIDIVCEYSYQPGGYAFFDNIAVTESSDGNVVEYQYYDSTFGELEGLLRRRTSGYDSEYYEYNSDRLITRIANNRGEIVDYIYASNGVDVANEIYYTFTYGNNSKIYPYLAANPDAAITKTPKTKTDYYYNSYGQLTATRTMALKSDLTRDPEMKNVTSSTSYLTTSGSKLFGAPLSSTDNLGRETRYIYNTASTYNYGDLMAVVNAYEGTGTCYTYDAIGNLQTATPCSYDVDEDTYSPVIGEENVTYTYSTTEDPRNLLHSVATGSTTYTFTYDSFGNSDAISVGSRDLASYEYNPHNGKIQKITYGNEFFVEYVYDELDNVKEVCYNGVEAYEYSYTAYGQLYRFDNLIDGTSTIYEYDPTGRLVHFTEFDSDTMVNEFSSLIEYDAEGRIHYYDYIGAYTNSSGVNDWSTTYIIDFLNDGRLNSFSLDANSNISTETATASVNFTYDKYNRPTNKAYTYSAPSQSFTGSASYTYTDTAISTSSQVATYTSTVGSSTVTSTYTYDGNGFITEITLSTGAEYRYVYDDLGQLLREDNTVTNKTYVYEYDDAGNITSKKTYALTAEGATPSSLVSSVTYGYTDSLGWGDLLTSYNGTTITYDAIGNPLTYYNGETYTFEWENGRQLAAVSSDDFEFEFVYNDEGIRTQKIANGAVHTYHLSGSQIISEEWGNHLLVYLYDSNGSPMGMQYRRSSMAEDVFYTFWFEKNLQGDIVAVYNSAGTKVVSYAYDAWGNCITTHHNISGTNSYANLNPFRYRGYYYDTELGFYYLNSRYYDPAVGRFINADVYINANGGFIGFNMFAYCNNMPINYRDPSGALMIDTSEPDTWTNYTLDQIAFIKSKTSNPYAEEEEIIRNFEAYVQSEADAHGMDYQETEDAILWSIISGEPWQYYNTTFEDLATVYLTNYAACSATDFSNVSQAMAGATASGVLTNNWISDLESDCRIYNRKPMDKFKAMAISTVASVADTINTMACLCFQAPPSVGASVSTVIYYGKQFLKKVLVGY